MKPKQFPKTILFLNDNPLPSVYTKGVVSGKELRLRSALNQVKEIHVLAPKGDWVGDKDNKEIGDLEKKIHIHHIPTCPYYFRTIPLFLWGLYWMHAIKPDLIETESPIISGPAGVSLSKWCNRPVVVEVRASYHELIKHKLIWIPFVLKKYLLDLVYQNTLKQASGVIANSRYYQNLLSKISVESVVVNPGIQLQSIEVPQSDKKSNITTLGFLGRIELEKGVAILLEAMQMILIQEKTKRNCRLLIAGEGSQRNRLESFVKNNPTLRTRVKFLGFQKAHDFLPKIDILVNPNIVQHPLEMVNVEAAFYGKPVICFGNELQPETVIDGKTGIKIKDASTSALAKVIIDLINDSKLYENLCTQTSRIAQEYSFKTQMKKLQNLYAQL